VEEIESYFKVVVLSYHFTKGTKENCGNIIQDSQTQKLIRKFLNTKYNCESLTFNSDVRCAAEFPIACCKENRR
jgi:hypothetical protein